MTFDFMYDHDGSLSLEAAVFQAMGTASVCWEKPEGAGEFQEDKCHEVGMALLEFINARAGEDQALLGLATTAQLLVELKARAEVSLSLDAKTELDKMYYQHMTDVVNDMLEHFPTEILTYRTVNRV